MTTAGNFKRQSLPVCFYITVQETANLDTRGVLVLMCHVVNFNLNHPDVEKCLGKYMNNACVYGFVHSTKSKVTWLRKRCCRLHLTAKLCRFSLVHYYLVTFSHCCQKKLRNDVTPWCFHEQNEHYTVERFNACLLDIGRPYF